MTCEINLCNLPPVHLRRNEDMFHCCGYLLRNCCHGNQTSPLVPFFLVVPSQESCDMSNTWVDPGRFYETFNLLK